MGSSADFDYRACTKWNVMVKSVAEIPRRINEAFRIATSGRPGPVLVDLPKDIQFAILRKPIPTSSIIPLSPVASLLSKDLSQKELKSALQRVARLVNMAEKPIIYAGQGVLADPGPQLLKELADKACVPVTTTVLGLGAFDELDEKSLHMLGMQGSPYANLAIQEADLIIALGARFDDRVTGNLPNPHKLMQLTSLGNIAKFAPLAKTAASENRGGFVHFEIQPKNINKVVQATEAIEGDLATNLAMITSGGLGTMGFGLPAAIGVKVARPEALVVDVDGDASFCMTLTELSTAAHSTLGSKSSSLTTKVRSRLGFVR